MRWIPNSLAPLVLLALLSLTSQGSLAAVVERSADNVWTSISADEFNTARVASAVPWIRPDTFNAVVLEPATISAVLAASTTILTVPRPDGGFERFIVSESSVMHPDLERWMADQGWPMKTYSGTSLDNRASTVRLDWGGPAGFHAMVQSPDGDYFIDPYWQGDLRHYSSYYKRDYTLQGEGKPWSEIGYVDPQPMAATAGSYQSIRNQTNSFNTGGNLRTYKMAVAGTAAYTAFHSLPGAPDKVKGQAAITTSVNRLNGLYENELSVRFQLVASNMDIVYENTDPYSSDSCSSAVLGENQTNIDTEIGLANYDIGHVFGKTAAGGGGLAGAGACLTSSKARGCSSSTNPQGDGFDLGLVAHEVGHQFSASHTFTGQGLNCTAGTFASAGAYEPGSGSTIMSYFGLCSAADNLEPPNGGYFHRKSLDQMGTYIDDTATCAAVTAVNPNQPVVSAGADHTIPIGTPFELTGTGSDADGDTLTFNWEQFDPGLQKPLSTGDDGVQPLFRSFAPTITGGTRVFPRQDTVVKGETLPATNRTMNFRLTARDNRAGGGRENDDLAQITSTTAAGPFAVTAPNGGEDFAASSAQTVTWNVASTDGGAVNTPNVDILLSHDGGLTDSETLVSNTPNDGSSGVIMPTTVSSSTARIKVKGSGNVFFDVSDADFSVDAKCSSPLVGIPYGGSVTDSITMPGGKTIADLNVKLDIDHTWVGVLTVSLQHDGGTPVVLIDKIGDPPVNIFPSCFYDDIRADLDDEGAAPVETCPFGAVSPAITGRLTPNNPLSAFDGQDIGGEWKLKVEDSGFTFEPGTLLKWCLDGWFGTPPVVACPPALVLSHQTLSGAQTLQATVSATLGPNLIVNGSDIVVNAPTVIFGDGVTIDGTFTAGNTPNCT